MTMCDFDTSETENEMVGFGYKVLETKCVPTDVCPCVCVHVYVCVCVCECVPRTPLFGMVRWML